MSLVVKKIITVLCIIICKRKYLNTYNKFIFKDSVHTFCTYKNIILKSFILLKMINLGI
jgi:hypothetical protein